jgi:hypothetical protein
VPPALEAVIMKCLAKKADVRYQSMQEVLADLELVEQGLTPGAVVEGVRRATMGGAGGSSARSELSSSKAAITMDVGDVRLPKKNTGLIIGVAAALALALGVGVFALSGGEDTTVKPEPAAPVQQQPAAGQPATAEPAQAEPAEPSPKPDAVPPPPEPPAVQVAISSKPDSVDVYSDGALIGHTPFEVQRPKAGEPAVELTLKADGYKDLPLRITQFSQQKLSVELDKERRKPGAVAPAPAQTPKPKPEPEETPKTKPRPSTEVLDPWG